MSGLQTNTANRQAAGLASYQGGLDQAARQAAESGDIPAVVGPRGGQGLTLEDIKRLLRASQGL